MGCARRLVATGRIPTGPDTIQRVAISLPRLSPQQRQKALRLTLRPQFLPLLRYGVFPSLEHLHVPFGDPLTVLDIGASRGQFATLLRHIRPKADIICFEPLPAAVETLQKVASRYQLQVYPTALDERVGNTDLHVASSDDSSSLLPPSAWMLGKSHDIRTLETIHVPTTRLDALDLNIQRPSLLKIDAQGAELRVLRGARNTLDRIDQAYVECSFIEMYEGQPLAAEVVTFMHDAGFDLAGVYNVALSRDGAHEQADFLFRRKTTPIPAVEVKRAGPGPAVDQRAAQRSDPRSSAAHLSGHFADRQVDGPRSETSADQTDPQADRNYRDYGWHDPRPEGAAPYVNRAIDRLIASPAGSRLLDVGCGNGYLAARFASRGCEVVGVDLSETGIALARKHHPTVRFELAAADDAHLLAKLGEPPFDYVVSTEVIEHVYAPDALVHCMYRALKPGGTAIISTPYHGYLKNVGLSLAGAMDSHWHPGTRGGHIKFWSRRTLYRLMLEAGFGELRFRGAGRLPLLWKSMVVTAKRPVHDQRTK